MLRPDGSSEHRYTTGPWHWRQSDADEWTEIDTDLEARPDTTWKHGVKSARFDTVLSDDGRRRFYPRRWVDTEYAEFGVLQYRRANGQWRTVPTGIMSRVENRLVGSDSADGRLEVGFTGRGQRTELVLKRATMARPLRWSVTLVGLTWQDGTLISDSDSAEVGFLRPPYWTDSSDNPEPRPIPWDYSGGYMTLTPDFSGAVYPVTVDPDYAITAGGDDYRIRPDTSSFDSTGTTLTIGNPFVALSVGFCFRDIAADQGDECTEATIALVVTAGSGTTILSDFWGVLEFDHSPPTTYSGWTDECALHTTATVVYDFTRVDWGNPWVTTDLSDIFSELFGDGDWESGYNVGLHWHEGGSASSTYGQFAAYDHATVTEPVLSLTLAAGGENATVTPAAGVLALSAPAVSRSGDAGRSPATGVLALTAPQTTVSIGVDASVTPAAGVLAFTGPQAGWSADAARAPPSAVLGLTGPQLSVSGDANVEGDPDGTLLTLTGPQVSVSGDANRGPAGGTLALTAPQVMVTVTQDATVSPAAGHLVLGGPQVSAGVGVTVSPAAGHLALTGPQAAPSGDATVSPAAGHLALTGPQAAVTVDANVTLTAAGLTLTGPQTTVSGDATVTPAAGALALSAPRARAGFDANVTLTAAGLTLTGPQTTVSGDATVTPAAGALTLTGPQVTPVITFDTWVTLTAAVFTLTAPQVTVREEMRWQEGTLTVGRAEGRLTVGRREGGLNVDSEEGRQI